MGNGITIMSRQTQVMPSRKTHEILRPLYGECIIADRRDVSNINTVVTGFRGFLGAVRNISIRDSRCTSCIRLIPTHQS